MRGNPELTRNLWLELTPHRLISMPAVLGLLFAFAATASQDLVPGLALGLFGLVTILWGASLCSEAMLEEFRQGTWDTQRLSAMGPWQLAWGKLMGAPVFSWYGGGICLVVFALTTDGTAASNAPLPTVLGALPTVLGALAMAVLTQAMGAILGLTAARSGTRTRSSLFIVFIFLFVSYGAWLPGSLARWDAVMWFGVAMSPVWFAVFSLWAFAAWGIVGFWRMLCGELQLRKPPLAWLGFAVFLTIYAAGLVNGRLPEAPPAQVFAFVAFSITISLSYGVVLFEQRNFISLRRLALHWHSGNLRRVWEEIPCWTVTLLLALVAALYLALQGIPVSTFGPVSIAVGTMPLVLGLFALRDIALLYFFSLGQRPQRALLATMIYLGLLYWLLPSLLDAAGLDALAAWLRPGITREATLGIAAGLANAAAGVALMVWRWRQRLAEMAR